MTNITENFKTTILCYEDESGDITDINPQTIASNVLDEKSSNVQAHINDTSIHMTESRVKELVADKLTAENIKAGENVTLTTDDSGNVTISALTDDISVQNSLIAEDLSITLTPTKDNKTKIRANIPDVSHFIRPENIKEGQNIKITCNEKTNDVIISGVAETYTAGDGIILEDGVINVALHDVLQAGTNIEISGEYPHFTISSSSKAKILDWKPNTKYEVNDFVTRDNGLFKCIKEHTSEGDFDTAKWQLWNGWIKNVEEHTVEYADQTSITLNNEVPNKDVLSINIGGVVQQQSNYELGNDGKTITFNEVIPQGAKVEVTIMSNVVLDTYHDIVNIMDWKSNTSYVIDNLCIYQDSIYKCIEAHVSGEEFEKEFWKNINGYSKHRQIVTIQELKGGKPYFKLDKYASDESDIMINFNGIILPEKDYDIDSSGYGVIIYNESIELGQELEVTIFSNASIQHPEVPTAQYRPNHILVSNVRGSGYELYSKDDFRTFLDIDGVNDLYGKDDYIAIVKDGKLNTVKPEMVGSIIGVRNDVNGFKCEANGSKITISEGSVLSSDGTTMIRLSKPLVKDVAQEFNQGNGNGCMIGTSNEVFDQPIIMTGKTTSLGFGDITVEASSEQTDRYAWKVMDGNIEGNGWFTNIDDECPIIWSISCPNEFTVHSFDFYNTDANEDNYSKDIDVWVDTPDAENVVASFTAEKEDMGHTHVEIENPRAGTKFGLTIKSSYNNNKQVGATKIDLQLSYSTTFASKTLYNIVALYDNEGDDIDIATIPHYDDIETSLPKNYIKYAIIGTFETDDNKNIINIYPNKDIKDKYLDGSIGGELDDNVLTQYVHDNDLGKPVQIIEQWGCDKPDEEGRITFTKPFSEIFYVMANGVKIISKDNDGFTVDSSIKTEIDWFAKGK